MKELFEEALYKLNFVDAKHKKEIEEALYLGSLCYELIKEIEPVVKMVVHEEGNFKIWNQEVVLTRQSQRAIDIVKRMVLY